MTCSTLLQCFRRNSDTACMRWMPWVALLALSCATTETPLPVGVPATGEAARALPETHVDGMVARISDLHIAFVDPATFERFSASGPYEVVSWNEGRLSLVGRDADGLGAARLDIRDEGGSLWVNAHIRDREFLLRVE